PKLYLRQRDPLQAACDEPGAAQIGPCKVSIIQDRRPELGVSQIAVRKVRMLQQGLISSDIIPPKIHAMQIEPGKVGTELADQIHPNLLDLAALGKGNYLLPRRLRRTR